MKVYKFGFTIEYDGILVARQPVKLFIDREKRDDMRSRVFEAATVLGIRTLLDIEEGEEEVIG